MSTRSVERIIKTGQIDVIRGLQVSSKIMDFLDDNELTEVTLTATGTSAAAPSAVNDAQHGTITFLAGTEDNSTAGLQMEAETIKLEAGKEYWCFCRFQIDEATQSDVIFGAWTTDSSPIASSPADGFWMYKADGGVTWDLQHRSVSGTTTVTDASAFGTLAANTWYVLAIHVKVFTSAIANVDIECFIDGVRVGGNTMALLPTATELAVGWHYQNGQASPVTGILDYIGYVAQR